MKTLKQLTKDNKAVVWVWVVIFASLFAFSLVWFATGWAVNIVAETVQDMYTFTGASAYAATFIITFFKYVPILFLFGIAIWGYVNSQRRQQY